MNKDRPAAHEGRLRVRHDPPPSEPKDEGDLEQTEPATESPRTESRPREHRPSDGASSARASEEATIRPFNVKVIVTRVSQVIDYIFYVIYGLFSLRFLLALLAARPEAGFVQFVHALTDPLYAPFVDIVPSLRFVGGYTVEWPIVIAVIVYALVHAGINGLLRMIVERKTSI